MLKHFLKTSFRNLLRNKTHALINIFGLSLGMICALIIFQKARHELSYDQHQPNKDRIYRVLRVNHSRGSEHFGSGVPYPLPKMLHNDFKDLPAITVVDGNFSSPVITLTDAVGNTHKFMEEKGVAFVEADYFKMFDYEWLAGDPITVFDNPYTVVISASIAKKYFGHTDVLGKVFNYDGQYDLQITGVVGDVPENTNVPFDILINFHLGEKDKLGNDNWGSISSSVKCFVMLPEDMKPEELDERFQAFLLKHAGEKRAKEVSLDLQPLLDIHYDTELSNYTPATSKQSIWVLIVIGIFLIITASINFVNLNTVLIFGRAKEIGLRKVLGSLPREIANYFLSETAIITFFALFVAIAFAPVAVHYMDELIQSPLNFNPFTDVWLLSFMLMMTAVVIALSGAYPAFLLSRLHPVMALKKQVDKSYGKGLNMRRGLVVIQFMISQLLIISTLVMMQQMDYFYRMPLGYDQNAILEVFLPDQDLQTLRTLKTELLRDPNISHVSFSNSGASSQNQWWSNFIYKPADAADENIIEDNTQVKLVDKDYLNTFGMNLIAGEGFLQADSVDRFIVNEQMIHALGFKEPSEALGAFLSVYGKDAPIMGVVQDFHTLSLHEKISPVVLMPNPKYYMGAIKLQHVTPEALAHIESSWQQAFPDKVYESNFLDENIAKFYEKEQRSAHLFQLFAGIAIFIGCMGLFGLISFMAAQRTREIGIRKVLGASIGHIVSIFSREFAWLVIIGFAVAAPLAWWGMNNWLEDFAYRIHIGLGVFFLAMVLSLFIVMLTVGYKSYRAATINPTQALREE